MNRRLWLRVTVSVAGSLVFAGLRGEARGTVPLDNLKETLRAALRCRRDEEFEFVDHVALKVEEGKLPLDLVLSMLKWARERRPDFPFPYFKEGIKRRAAAFGVDL